MHQNTRGAKKPILREHYCVTNNLSLYVFLQSLLGHYAHRSTIIFSRTHKEQVFIRQPFFRLKHSNEPTENLFSQLAPSRNDKQLVALTKI